MSKNGKTVEIIQLTTEGVRTVRVTPAGLAVLAQLYGKGVYYSTELQRVRLLASRVTPQRFLEILRARFGERAIPQLTREELMVLGDQLRDAS